MTTFHEFDGADRAEKLTAKAIARVDVAQREAVS
jgi:hypothetical protein